MRTERYETRISLCKRLSPRRLSQSEEIENEETNSAQEQQLTEEIAEENKIAPADQLSDNGYPPNSEILEGELSEEEDERLRQPFASTLVQVCQHEQALVLLKDYRLGQQSAEVQKRLLDEEVPPLGKVLCTPNASLFVISGQGAVGRMIEYKNISKGLTRVDRPSMQFPRLIFEVVYFKGWIYAIGGDSELYNAERYSI